MLAHFQGPGRSIPLTIITMEWNAVAMCIWVVVCKYFYESVQADAVKIVSKMRRYERDRERERGR